MPFLLAARRLVAPFMVGVLAFAVLLPALGQLLPKPAGVPWLELCTSAGFKRVTGNAPVDAPAGSHEKEHCPFCRLQHDLPFVPSRAAELPRPDTQTIDADRPSPEGGRSARRWILALSHAPPALP